ncbi:TonB-dependent receptor [Paraglaciecola arctica]|nr:TonB-dependent receptor [Paraglaciecola arctica]
MIKLNKVSSAMENGKFSRVLSKTVYTSTLACMMAIPIMAQESDTAPAVDDATEVIEVKGIRQTIQDSISIKRLSTSIVDGLSADDIGDLPALSIGEALETLTGASSHREQGGATEISIRGLGPFLGSTVFNGREAANGSGDRSVNFSQFPSELFNKIAIYKTQEASLIEGGVSGQISLETVKPLDYGKTRFQAQVKGNWNPGESDINNSAQDFGSRITASFVDQYETDNIGDIGFSIGVQKDLKSNPEQEARTTSGWASCKIDPSDTGSGLYNSGDCGSSGTNNLNLEVDPATGVAPDQGVPYIFVPSSYSYRQNITEDDRESIFAAVQWRPSETFEVNIDAQYSDRVFQETRNDFLFPNSRRPDSANVSRDGQLPVDLVITDEGSLVSATYLQRPETISAFQERMEEYKGGGISFIYDVSDVLSISSDFSVSKTERRENIYETRLRTSNTDINGNSVSGTDANGYAEAAIVVGQDGSLIPLMTLRNFDVNNAEAFANASEVRTRVDTNQFRNNTITAFRTDFEYLTDSEVISQIKGGVRYSKLEYVGYPRTREEYTDFNDADALKAGITNCKNDSFPESGFLSSVTGGQPLFTNLDDDGNVIAQGTGNTYATFDPLCIATMSIGSAPVFPDPEDTVAKVDVEEKTTAVYLQADYDTLIGDYGVRGNFGIRYVTTDVTSLGLRGPLETTTAINQEGLEVITSIDLVSGAELIEVAGGSSYSELLPSLNVVVDVSDDVLLRGAVYRALSRPSPSDMGFGRSFNGLADESEEVESIDVAIGTATANGNPNIKPFTSWNADVAIEWYPNEDTILAFGTYYKSFEGGFENVSTTETFTVDGQELDTLVTVQQTNNDTSAIYGVEMTATHAFSYLPSIWSNFGVKLSYNWADSDFEVEDTNFGSSNIVAADGTVIQRVGIVDPAEIFGFSDTVMSGQFYYQDGGFNAQLIYKYRSEYFQQYLSTPGNLRYVGSTGVYEARVSYKVNKNLKVSVEAINLFDEPKRQFIPSPNNFGEINVYGPRIYVGIQYKL